MHRQLRRTLAFGVSRAADYWSCGATWESSGGFVSHVFTKQALPMVWDYAESNPFSGGTGNWSQTCMEWIVRVIRDCDPKVAGVATQAAAQDQRLSTQKVVSTDPPYFNNISYAILADYFYAWLRRSLRPIYPDLFATVSTPKAEELVASNARHDGKQAAEAFFLDGMTTALASLSATAHPAYPVTIYYAYKQAATGDAGTSSAGWERFLEATLNAGLRNFRNVADSNRTCESVGEHQKECVGLKHRTRVSLQTWQRRNDIKESVSAPIK